MKTHVNNHVLYEPSQEAQALCDQINDLIFRKCTMTMRARVDAKEIARLNIKLIEIHLPSMNEQRRRMAEKTIDHLRGVVGAFKSHYVR